jgi:cell division protein FtsB
VAIYQGASPRAGLAVDRVARRRGSYAPAAALAPATAIPRRRARSAVRAGRRPDRVGLVLGGIVLAFMLAFFSLAQSVRVSATGYDLAAIQAEHDRLEAVQQDLVTNINRLGSGPAIRKQALDAGLSPLAAPIVVPVR